MRKESDKKKKRGRLRKLPRRQSVKLKRKKQGKLLKKPRRNKRRKREEKKKRKKSVSASFARRRLEKKQSASRKKKRSEREKKERIGRERLRMLKSALMAARKPLARFMKTTQRSRVRSRTLPVP